MSKSMKIFNIIMSALIFLGGTAYLCAGLYDWVEYPVYVKAFASALFVATGLVNLIYVLKNQTKNKMFPIMLFVGLVFAFLGDVLLEIQFIVGAGLFALGHVLFFVSYCFLSKISWKDLLFGLAVFVPSLLIILLVPIFKFDGIMKIVCIVYALIISFMVGKAISNLVKNKSLLNVIILVGSCLFFFSDMMLLFSNFGGVAVCGAFCLLTYYPAEFFLAYSIFKSNN